MAAVGARVTAPLSGTSSPARAASSVDLPAPFGPTTPTREPGATVRETSASTSAGPRVTVRPVATRVADTAPTLVARDRGRDAPVDLHPPAGRMMSGPAGPGVLVRAGVGVARRPRADGPAQHRRRAVDGPGSRTRTCCSSTAGTRRTSDYWVQASGLAEYLPALPDNVWLGVSAGSMVMTPRIGSCFVEWAPAPDDRGLGVVDFSIFPHLNAFPSNSMADAERWAADIGGPDVRSTSRAPSRSWTGS